ncbi:hypothetical protein [Vallitalea guaymasensis]|uniref:DNA polymerase III subunit beta family protein n=1 Tax=Vallitalea guaymasensis TaxID=1185412 RepID=UPI000DE38B5C|nr:hypothetical protein [Vallitalea guaymasensis]
MKKIVINKVKLIEEIKKVKAGLGKSNSNMKLTFAKNKVIITSCDYSKQIFCFCNLVKEVQDTIEIVVDGILFSNIILSASNVNTDEFILELSKTSLVVKAGDKFLTTIGVKPDEDFISIMNKNNKDEAIIKMKTDVLIEAINCTGYCADEQEQRDLTKCLCFTTNTEKKILMISAMSSPRLGLSKCTYEEIKKDKDSKDINFLIPAHDIMEIAKFLKDEFCEIRICEKFVKIKSDKFNVVIKRMHCQYLDVLRLIPKDGEVVVLQLKKAELLNAINMSLAIVDRTNRKPTIYEVIDKKVTLISKSDKGEMKIEVEIEKIEAKEERFKISLNNMLVKEAITNIPSEQFIIKFYGTNKPMIIYPTKLKYSETIGLIVPIKITDEDMNSNEEQKSPNKSSK